MEECSMHGEGWWLWAGDAAAEPCVEPAAGLCMAAPGKNNQKVHQSYCV